MNMSITANNTITISDIIPDRTKEIQAVYEQFADKDVIYKAKATNGNKKLGSSIFNINLPAVITCNPNAPCFHQCYATHGHFMYPNVRNSMNNNLFAFIQNPDMFFDDIAEQTKLSLYTRWFGSGDMPNEQFLEGMCKVARKNKNVKYLAFTKQYKIVNHYIATGHKIPKNLIIVFSTWMAWVPENPYNFPMTYVKFDPNKKAEEKFARFNDLIPEQAFQCPNGCANCLKCWQLKKGESVYFKKH